MFNGEKRDSHTCYYRGSCFLICSCVYVSQQKYKSSNYCTVLFVTIIIIIHLNNYSNSNPKNSQRDQKTPTNVPGSRRGPLKATQASRDERDAHQEAVTPGDLRGGDGRTSVTQTQLLPNYNFIFALLYNSDTYPHLYIPS